MPTLDFKGKQFIYSHHHNVPFRELVVDADKSLSASPSVDDNLVIHGDNLHGLKALLPLYAGKIKCIYIDPPYNTGKEGWCYNDNVNSPLMKEWLAREANPVNNEDLERHDKWLCMMYPRLKLLHELLSDDGVIFVSVDDNEVHHLRAIMDEIFGEENFVGSITREMKKGANRGKHLAPAIDYVIVYARSLVTLKNFHLPVDENYIKSFNHDDNDGRGQYKLTNLYEPSLDYYQNCRYPIQCPDGTVVITPNNKSFTHNKESFERMLADNSIVFIEARSSQLIKTDGAMTNWAVKRKIFLKDMIEKGRRPSNLLLDIINAEGTKCLNSLNITFDYAKPIELIEYLIAIINGKDSIILDSFAGSGTTAHAVLDLNKQDGGNRKFILIECEDYADTITAERVRRVIKGVPTAKDEKLQQGLGGSFTFVKLGDAFSIEKMLTGESLPEYSALANYVFYTATGISLKSPANLNDDFYVGETDIYQIYLIYKPDIAFLRSNDSALNGTRAELISKHQPKGKTKLVFATAKYMSQKDLTAHKITFCQLPYSIHRIIG